MSVSGFSNSETPQCEAELEQSMHCVTLLLKLLFTFWVLWTWILLFGSLHRILVSLLRPKEVIWTRATWEGGVTGAGGAVTVSPSGGHTSCWGICAVSYLHQLNLVEVLGLKSKVKRTRGRLMGGNDKIKIEENVKYKEMCFYCYKYVHL